MPIEITYGSTRSSGASNVLARLLVGQRLQLNGQLYIGFPILPSSEKPQPVDALLLCDDGGIILFDLVDGDDPGDFKQRQDDVYNRMEARLKLHRPLLRGRNLRISISTLSFAPGCSQQELREPHLLVSSPEDLLDQVRKCYNADNDDNSMFRQVLSALDGVAKIRLNTAVRPECVGRSRCAKLRKIENVLVSLDRSQRNGSLEMVEGVQRIRGLAGSGKTVVLARKAAYLHVLHPDWTIGVTFHTRSLKGFFKRLIRMFVYHDVREEPNWDKLHIVNAWGAPGAPERSGLYYQYCEKHGLEHLTFSRALRLYGRRHAFRKACEKALHESESPLPYYDALLIDEAQDLPLSFLRLCYRFAKSSKRLVYCYDELQNLTGESLPSPENIFGHRNGRPNVQLEASAGLGPKPDIVLPNCYRTPGPVLTVAHAVGFGIYRRPTPEIGTGLVQMFDHPALWNDIGYHVESGELTPGHEVVLGRTRETSPSFLEEHSDTEDLVLFKSFKSEEEQHEWLVQAIEENLHDDLLVAADIMVIHPDPRTTKSAAVPIQSMLYERNIYAHIAGVDTSADTFNREDRESVIISSAHRAKGNEAGMVYVINAHSGLSSRRNLSSIRNRLFTAITRTKAWVRVLGVGDEMNELCREFARLRELKFRLHFTYPTEEQSRYLRTIHRDMTKEEESRLRRQNRSLKELVGDLEAGDMNILDLDQDMVGKLLAVLEAKNG